MSLEAVPLAERSRPPVPPSPARASSPALLGGTSKGATEVVIHNERAETISLAMTITGAKDGVPRYDETITLESLEWARPDESDKLPEGTDYTIEVDVEDGPSETFEWRDVRLELAPLHVIVDGSSNVLFALQAG